MTKRASWLPGRSVSASPVRRGVRSTVPVAVAAAVVAAAALATANLLGSSSASQPGSAAPSAGQVAAIVSTSTPAASPSELTIPSNVPASAPPSPHPSPSATPAPIRRAVQVNIEPHPNAVFKTEVLNTWCAAAAVQMTLNVIGPTIDTTTARQKRIHLLEVANTTRADSRSGGVGPLGMAKTLSQLGPVRYELRVYRTRAIALRDAARAISVTRHPVILLAWYGAHAWVMTGFRADADPRVFANATVLGADVLDAWYPRISSIWGPSDPPGTYQNSAEMVRNYLPWKRPEAHYPGWDGRFLALVPAAAPSG